MAQHLLPGGCLLAGFTLEPGGYGLDAWDEHCRSSGLELEARWSTWSREPYAGGDYHVSVHRRSDRFNVHDLLAEARSNLDRVTPRALATRATEGGTDVVVIDIRQGSDRAAGWIAGSVHAPRTVLEWRIDAASGYSIPEIVGFDQRLVVVCTDGYSSSLAAKNLQRLGYHRATDMIGGFEAWRSAGLPVVTRAGEPS